MSMRPTAARVATFIAAAIVVACSGEEALVSPHVDGAPPFGVVSNPEGAVIRPVSRDSALAVNDTFSFDVGPLGTLVRRSSMGLTIQVPAGAVAAPTHITVIALKGASLAYRFEPHGLHFAVPLQLTQSLRGVRLNEPLSVPQLFAGYFADDSLPVDATGNARVIEILPVHVDVMHRTALLEIRHFSGYTVASASSDSLSDAR
ncbi:MAG TPA: hypothetical protein VJN70_20475 [Gemmatimonadaceae bacterium]|nr:hypothetical protein [Gemmatimonadaceae bacterium]